MVLYVNGDIETYFDSFRVEDIQKKVKKVIVQQIFIKYKQMI